MTAKNYSLRATATTASEGITLVVHHLLALHLTDPSIASLPFAIITMKAKNKLLNRIKRNLILRLTTRPTVMTSSISKIWVSLKSSPRTTQSKGNNIGNVKRHH